jgi:hypothetical protein
MFDLLGEEPELEDSCIGSGGVALFSNPTKPSLFANNNRCRGTQPRKRNSTRSVEQRVHAQADESLRHLCPGFPEFLVAYSDLSIGGYFAGAFDRARHQRPDPRQIPGSR